MTWSAAHASPAAASTCSGGAAQPQRALANWFLDVHVEEHGFQEVYPPFMVREECMVGTGNLPKFGDVLYRDAEEDYWFIPTAEVPVTNLHRDEIIEAGALPLYYVAHTLLPPRRCPRARTCAASSAPTSSRKWRWSSS